MELIKERLELELTTQITLNMIQTLISIWRKVFQGCGVLRNVKFVPFKFK